jgi:hypothetical protein
MTLPYLNGGEEMNSIFRLAIVLLVVMSLVAGCATTGEDTSGRVFGTAIGAVTGALIGANKHGTKGALAGALIGGTAGFAAGWLVDGYRAKKTKSAQQVREQYEVKSQYANVPTKLGGYNIMQVPTRAVPRGETTEIMTTFDIIGRDGNPIKVTEEQTVLRPDGTKLANKRYEYKEVDGPGGYEFSHSVPVPKGVDQGYYSVNSILYINGMNAGTTNSNFQVVSRGSARMIARR